MTAGRMTNTSTRLEAVTSASHAGEASRAMRGAPGSTLATVRVPADNQKARAAPKTAASATNESRLGAIRRACYHEAD